MMVEGCCEEAFEPQDCETNAAATFIFSTALLSSYKLSGGGVIPKFTPPPPPLLSVCALIIVFAQWVQHSCRSLDAMGFC